MESVKVEVKKAKGMAKKVEAKATDVTAKTVKEVKETTAKAKEAVTKTATAKAATTKKTATRKVRGTQAKAKEVVKAATENASKKIERITELKVDTKMSLQFGGRNYSSDELTGIAKDVWKYDLNQRPGDLKKIDLYVKPEENKTYYVMNGEYTGSFFI